MNNCGDFTIVASHYICCIMGKKDSFEKPTQLLLEFFQSVGFDETIINNLLYNNSTLFVRGYNLANSACVLCAVNFGVTKNGLCMNLLGTNHNNYNASEWRGGDDLPFR